MSESEGTLPEVVFIEPLTHPPDVTVTVPGSKSITNRALILAALAHPRSDTELTGALHCEDTDVMIKGLRSLGFHVQADWRRSAIQVSRGGSTRLIPASGAELFVANSGTTMRFLTALVSLGEGRYRLDGVARMRERPIEDLLAALRQMGSRVWSERQNGFPPVVVLGQRLRGEAFRPYGGQIQIRGDLSSQFLSALLMVAPFAREGVRIEVVGPLVSVPYVKMTVAMMERFGVAVETDLATSFRVARHEWYEPQTFAVEPDATAASYFFGAAAITGGTVTVTGLSSRSLQGDVRFVEVLGKMGCEIHSRDNALTVRGGRLHGIDVDLNDMSDCVLTLAAVACFASGPTTIRNVAHIRHKECDRLKALATELRRVGAAVEERADGLTITPRPLYGAAIETYSDHRMAMSMALIGLKVRGIALTNPDCVAKTYPSFFKDLERLRS
jgi:3-phosphoshikimate 1-carboxyvinyltransferase